MRHYHDHNGVLQATIIGVQFVHLVLEVNPIRPHQDWYKAVTTLLQEPFH